MPVQLGPRLQQPESMTEASLLLVLKVDNLEMETNNINEILICMAVV